MCGTISRTLKGKTQFIKFYKVMAVPFLMYGSENWSLNQSDKREIEAAEMRFLRPMSGYTARMEEGRSALKILTGKPTGKRALGRPRLRWEDNIRMDLEEIGINAGNWVDSAQDRDYWRALVNATLNLRVP